MTGAPLIRWRKVSITKKNARAEGQLHFLQLRVPVTHNSVLISLYLVIIWQYQ
jgi:hypothetical protein